MVIVLSKEAPLCALALRRCLLAHALKRFIATIMRRLSRREGREAATGSVQSFHLASDLKPGHNRLGFRARMD
jgi:hypothetical protein